MKRERIGTFSLIAMLGLVMVIIIKAIIFPMVISLVGSYTTLIKLYSFLEMSYSFFGGLALLFISWFIFSAVCRILWWLYVMIKKLIERDALQEKGA